MRWPVRLGLAFSGAILLLAAVLAYLAWQRPGYVYSEPGDWKNFSNQDPRHPVTEEMRGRSAATEGDRAPQFELPGPENTTVRFAELLQGGPVVVIATKDKCPCSIQSQPYFNELATHYEGKVSFVGLIDLEPKAARDYKVDFRVPYPLACDPSGDVMRSFGAPQSVYTSLVTEDGEIIRQWPGYSASMLMELDLEISHVTKSGAARLDTSHAPQEPTSGCYFAPSESE